MRQGAVDGSAADVAGGGSHNGGLLTTIGALGEDVTDQVALDISGADLDYTDVFDMTVTFNPGETFKTVQVSILGDTLAEKAETVGLSLSAVGGGGTALLGDRPTALLVIK